MSSATLYYFAFIAVRATCRHELTLKIADIISRQYLSLPATLFREAAATPRRHSGRAEQKDARHSRALFDFAASFALARFRRRGAAAAAPPMPLDYDITPYAEQREIMYGHRAVCLSVAFQDASPSMIRQPPPILAALLYRHFRPGHRRRPRQSFGDSQRWRDCRRHHAAATASTARAIFA